MRKQQSAFFRFLGRNAQFPCLGSHFVVSSTQTDLSVKDVYITEQMEGKTLAGFDPNSFAAGAVGSLDITPEATEAEKCLIGVKGLLSALGQIDASRPIIEACFKDFYRSSLSKSGAFEIARCLKAQFGNVYPEAAELMLAVSAELIRDELGRENASDRTENVMPDLEIAYWLAREVYSCDRQLARMVLWRCGKKLQGPEADDFFCKLDWILEDGPTDLIGEELTDSFVNGMEARGGSRERKKRELKEAGRWVEPKKTPSPSGTRSD